VVCTGCVGGREVVVVDVVVVVVLVVVDVEVVVEGLDGLVGTAVADDDEEGAITVLRYGV
jgi:hypothetical protein